MQQTVFRDSSNHPISTICSFKSHSIRAAGGSRFLPFSSDSGSFEKDNQEVLCDCVLRARVHLCEKGFNVDPEEEDSSLHHVFSNAFDEEIFDNGSYHFPSLTQSKSEVHRKNPIVPLTNESRVLTPFIQLLPDKRCSFSRIYQGMNSPNVGETGCSCIPEPLTEFAVNECAQMALKIVSSGVVKWEYIPCEILEVVLLDSGMARISVAVVGDVGMPPSTFLQISPTEFTSAQSTKTDRVMFVKYGFIPGHKSDGPAVLTYEYAATGVWTRNVFAAMCMFKRCSLDYDGADDGLFRYSKFTTFSIDLFYTFFETMVSQRF